jgi:hypothetical protein
VKPGLWIVYNEPDCIYIYSQALPGFMSLL